MTNGFDLDIRIDGIDGAGGDDIVNNGISYKSIGKVCVITLKCIKTLACPICKSDNAQAKSCQNNFA